MISKDLRFEGFDARSWTNLLSLFAPGVVTRLHEQPHSSDAPEVSAAEPAHKRTGSLVLVRSANGRLLQSFHTARGRVRDLVFDGDEAKLSALASTYAARRVVVVEEGALEELMERVALRLTRGEDYVAQMLTMARALRELLDAKRIVVWPSSGTNVPIPSPQMVERALDIVLPNDHVFLAVLWDRGKPWTGFALRRRRGDIDLCAGPDFIGRWTGPLGGDWRRDHRVVTSAVERVIGPVHLGLYAEVDTIRSLLRDPDPGAWARAFAVRDIIVSPVPPYIAVALGADAMRAAAKKSSELLGGIDALATLAPVARYLRGRIHEITSVTATLGFDPLRALAEALRRTPSDGGPANDTQA